MGLLFIHMHIPLSYLELPLPASPNLTQISKNGKSLTCVTAGVRLEESDIDETCAFRGLFCEEGAIHTLQDKSSR